VSELCARQEMSITESMTVSESSTDGDDSLSAALGGQLNVHDELDAVLNDFRARHLEKYRQPLTIGLMAGYVLVFLLSLAGNLLVLIVVLSNKAMRTTTNYFLVNLSVADLLGLSLQSAERPASNAVGLQKIRPSKMPVIFSHRPNSSTASTYSSLKRCSHCARHRTTSCVKASSAVIRCRAQCEHRFTIAAAAGWSVAARSQSVCDRMARATG